MPRRAPPRHAAPRRQVLIKLVSPYKRVTLDFISKEINVSVEEVEAILTELILDRRVSGKIDQTRGFLDQSMGHGRGQAGDVATEKK